MMAVNQQIIRLMLGRMAYPADFADNGLEALGALERRQYDLIFMDMQMPEMDGLECTRQVVRRYPPKHRPKIVAVTANVTAENAQECMAAGMDDFLTKPVKPLELRKCLEQWGRQLAAGRPADSGSPPAAVPIKNSANAGTYGKDSLARSREGQGAQGIHCLGRDRLNDRVCSEPARPMGDDDQTQSRSTTQFRT
jgi:CheY-like chemotaxis protein